MPPVVPPTSGRNAQISSERTRNLPPQASQSGDRPRRGGPPSAISNQEASRLAINSDTHGRSGSARTVSGARRRLGRGANNNAASEPSSAREGDNDGDRRPLVVHATDPHQQYTRSNLWQQIFSMLHDAASKVSDMGQKVVDLAHRGMEIISTRIS